MADEQTKIFRIIDGGGESPLEPEPEANEWLAGEKGKVEVTRTEIVDDVLNIYYRMRD